MQYDPSLEREREFTSSKGIDYTVEVYWDKQDPQNMGWAFRIRYTGTGEGDTLDSGPLDSDDPWAEVAGMFPEING